MNIAKKELNNCEIVNIWANTVTLMRELKKQDDLFLDELYLLSLIYKIVLDKGKPANQQNISDRFNILSYRRDKMLDNLISRGYVKNDMEGPRGHFKPFRLIVSPLGEQLLIKYERAMRKLCEGEK